MGVDHVKRRPKQSDIADRLGISQVAVSKALNGAPDISEAIRKQVVSTAEQLGYRPNMIARSLAVGKTHILGYTAPTLKGEFFAGLMESIQLSAAAAEYRVLVTTHNRTLDVDDPEIDLFMHSHVDGIIAFPKAAVPWEQTAYADLLRRRVPIVFLNQDVTLPGAVSVFSDGYGGARQAVAHMVQHGHRAIGAVLPAAEMDSTVIRRLEGYRAGMAEAGLVPRDDWVWRLDGHEPAELGRRIKAHPELTGLFCYNDGLALGVYGACRELGLSIPRDLSVVGFGAELQYNHLLHTPLTSVSQCSAEMGRVAVKLMLGILDGQLLDARHIIPTRLVEAASVTPPRTAHNHDIVS